MPTATTANYLLRRKLNNIDETLKSRSGYPRGGIPILFHAGSISRVPYPGRFRKETLTPGASAIYLARGSLLRIVSDLPSGSGGQPSRTGEREPLLPSIAGIHGLATRGPYGCRCHQRHRWSLTPPFHPYPCGRSFSVTVARPRGHLQVSEARRPVLLGLSSPACAAAAEPPCLYRYAGLDDPAVKKFTFP